MTMLDVLWIIGRLLLGAIGTWKTNFALIGGLLIAAAYSW